MAELQGLAACQFFLKLYESFPFILIKRQDLNFFTD